MYLTSDESVQKVVPFMRNSSIVCEGRYYEKNTSKNIEYVGFDKYNKKINLQHELFQYIQRLVFVKGENNEVNSILYAEFDTDTTSTSII